MDNNLKKFLSAKISKLKLTANDLPDLFKLAAKKFPAPAVEILETIVDCFYEQKQHENWLVALDNYLEELAVSGAERYHLLTRKYCEQVEQCKKKYEHNIELLMNYQWCFRKEFLGFNDLEKILLFHDQQIQTYLNKDGSFCSVNPDKVEIPEEQLTDTFFLLYCNNLSNLQDLSDKIKNNRLELNTWALQPIYLYNDPKEFGMLLLQGEIDYLLNKKRLVFFFSWQEVEKFFANMFAIPVKAIWSGYQENRQVYVNEFLNRFNNMHEKSTENHNINLQSNKKYYLQHKKDVVKNIRGKKPKILFVTTRFSTALQYHIRDCMLACERLGCSTRLVIEQGDIYSVNTRGYAEAVKDFKPDLWFQINYFANREIVPKEILAVNWIQDPMPHLTDPKTPLALDKNDCMLASSKEGLEKIGYLPEQILVTSIPANHLIYQPYQLDEQERAQYGADIILVSNRNDFATEVERIEKELFVQLTISEKALLKKILWQYYKLTYEEKINLVNQKSVEEYLAQELKTKLGIILAPESLAIARERFHVHTKAIAFRNTLADWLIDGGYTNLKLYGNDWASNPKFAPYAMGVAPNGEMLSKIYQSAKIVLGTNLHSTGPARVYETFLSGGFYLANYIAPEYDGVDIRIKYVENEEIPFFYNRQDLYAKLDYFLANPDERKKITERTRAKMLENDTYEVLMKRMLDWLAEKV